MQNFTRNNADKVAHLVFDLAKSQGMDADESQELSTYIWLVLTGHELPINETMEGE